MWVAADAREEERFQAFFHQALEEIGATRRGVGTASARGGQGAGLERLAHELSAFLMLLRAAREGGLSLAVAQREAARLRLTPLSLRGLAPEAALAALRLEGLRARVVRLIPQAEAAGEAALPQGHAHKREKPLRRPMGRQRLRLVVTNP